MIGEMIDLFHMIRMISSLFSEDLVLAEDRTTEADRELIMEGRLPAGTHFAFIKV